MRYVLTITMVVAFCVGCMFVTESYTPDNEIGYEIKGSCIGLTWSQCQARAEDLCAQTGKTVKSIKTARGKENKPGIAIVPKKIIIECTD